ncbi:hypothetical protein ILUMI_06622 [Ignelater luminosus]|uniref:Cytochrome P450 n=1 Tax=Ignelater luminosus TaxID=2038154 RepID=A0A8K0GIV2_IGNLU|nr:hypothetical protein ILUMI_06622 [Ignelater luminosus]
MWLIILISVLVSLAYFFGIKPYRHWKRKGIQYVKPLPLFGNIAPNMLQKQSFSDLLQDLYYTYPNQRYVGLYQFTQPVLLVRDPDLIKQITVKDFDVFPERRQFASEDIDLIWSKNLFAIRGGTKWHDMRSTLSPSFTSSKMRMMFNLMKNCSKQFVKHWHKESGIVTLEMKDVFTRFANDIIATTAFGVDCDSLANPNNEFYLMGKDVSDFSGIKSVKFFLSTLSPTLMKMLNVGIFTKKASTFFQSLIKQTLSIREKNGIVRPDMLHLLMEARKGRLANDDSNASDSGYAVVEESKYVKGSFKSEKPQITDEDITAQALVFFLGGFDSASSLMCFATYELAVHSDIQDKLRKEIDEVYENANGNISYEGLLGMKYLDMVVTESLRKWPPVIAAERMSVKPFTIEPELPGEKSVTLDKGTNVWIPIYAFHRDPKYYPNPEKFDPERFSEENRQNIQPFTYMPFGVGPRNCIGSRFALLEGKLVIAEIIRNFEIVPVEKTQVPMKLKKDQFPPFPENGFWLGLKKRTHV